MNLDLVELVFDSYNRHGGEALAVNLGKTEYVVGKAFVLFSPSSGGATGSYPVPGHKELALDNLEAVSLTTQLSTAIKQLPIPMGKTTALIPYDNGNTILVGTRQLGTADGQGVLKIEACFHPKDSAFVGMPIQVYTINPGLLELNPTNIGYALTRSGRLLLIADLDSNTQIYTLFMSSELVKGWSLKLEDQEIHLTDYSSASCSYKRFKGEFNMAKLPVLPPLPGVKVESKEPSTQDPIEQSKTVVHKEVPVKETVAVAVNAPSVQEPDPVPVAVVPKRIKPKAAIKHTKTLSVESIIGILPRVDSLDLDRCNLVQLQALRDVVVTLYDNFVARMMDSGADSKLKQIKELLDEQSDKEA